MGFGALVGFKGAEIGLELGMSSESREERARRRRITWTGELRTDQTPAQLKGAAERLLSMWTLAQDVFGYGPEAPSYDRANMPGRLVRIE